MATKKKTRTLELSDAVDIPALKDMLREAGCVIPTGFEVELEKYLRMLMARYIPRDTKEHYQNTSEMSKAMRGLFAKTLYFLTTHEMVTEDDNAIRIWDREFFEPSRGAIQWAPDSLIKFHEKINSIKQKNTGHMVEPSQITRHIPKTISHRKGHHKYVMFVFGPKSITILNSKNPDGLKSEIAVGSDILALNLLLLKDKIITARLIRSKGKRNLLLTGNQFEIFFK